MKKNTTMGFGFLESMFLLLGVVIVVLIGLHFLHKDKPTNNTGTGSTSSNNQSSTPPSSSSNSYATLAPATVASKTPECSQSISFNSSGVSEPVTCSNGYLNSTEWVALAANEPTVLTLGYGASSSQVQAALCRDINTNESAGNEEVIYQIAALYYGWSFASPPSPSAC